MSHFTVLVIGNDPEGQLAPYQENNMGTCPEEYMEFDEIDLQEYYEGNKEKALADGYIEKDGKIGCMTNPNSHWDWYLLGGRWAGFFKAKGHGGIVGVPGTGNNKIEEGRLDQGKKSDIDFDGMYSDAADKATLYYDEVAALFGGSIPIVVTSWKDTLDEHKANGQKLDIDLARAQYQCQESLIKYKILQDDNPKGSDHFKELTKNQQEFLHGFNWGDPILEQFMCSRDEFIGRSMADSISTYAVVKDGEWYAQGEMGWFAMSNDNMTADEWSAELHKLIGEASDDTLFSLYDCHV